jgi:gluconate 5-dehydrogenase
MTRDMAVNFAPWNINVNAISPGMFPSPAVVKKYGEEIFDKLIERTPLKREGRDDDLKGAAVYLSSDASDFVTGHNLVVDGGWLAW